MLKEINFHRLPCSRFVNRCITLSALIACTWIGCWSVSAQTTTGKERSDSKVVAASHTAPVKMFSQPTAAPWEVLGNQPGYLKMDVSRVVKHPYAKICLTPLWADLNSAFKLVENEQPSIEKFGLSLDQITQFQAGIAIFNNYNPDQPEGQRYSVGFNMSKAEVTTANPVDWPAVVNAFDFEQWRTSFSDTEVDLDGFRKSCLSSAKKSRTYLLDGEGLWNTRTFWNKMNKILLGSPTKTKKTVWEAVSGGAVTIVYDIGQIGEVPEDYFERDRLDQANLEMTNATEIAAWGGDLSEDYKTFQIRFAAVPKDGVSVDELLEKFEALKVEVAAHTDDDVITQTLLKQFMKAKVTTVEGELRDGTMTKDYLFIEGECTIDFAEFLKAQKW